MSLVEEIRARGRDIAIVRGEDDSPLAALLGERVPGERLDIQSKTELRPAGDQVSSPDHYTRGTISYWEAVKGLGLGPAEAQILKYLVRHPFKGEQLTDLCKARWYLDDLISDVESAGAIEASKGPCCLGCGEPLGDDAAEVPVRNELGQQELLMVHRGCGAKALSRFHSGPERGAHGAKGSPCQGASSD